MEISGTVYATVSSGGASNTTYLLRVAILTTKQNIMARRLPASWSRPRLLSSTRRISTIFSPLHNLLHRSLVRICVQVTGDASCSGCAHTNNSPTEFVQDFVGEIIRVLAIQVDYVVEPSHDALLKNTQLPSCIAMLISLGFRGDMRPRSFQSTYGHIAASIRHVAFNLTVATSAQFNVAGRKSPMDDSGEQPFLRRAS